ncbi:MAG: GNAT family N-acetyltransferase [Saprospiraceae bacterium]|nr:GNAT family N-acetyltransferase [Saprospiraceae bacterium]
MKLFTEIPEIGLRPLEKRDIPDLARCANNPRIAHFVRDRFPSPYTEQDAITFLELQLKEGRPEQMAITDQDRLIGMMGAIPQTDVYRLSAEFGYWVSEDYWGKGIATAAARVFTPWLFDQTDLIRVYARVFAFNPASRRVLEKSGFIYEGLCRDAVIKEGKIHDEYYYALLKKDQHED